MKTSVSFLCRYFSVSEARKVFVCGCFMRCIVKSYFLKSFQWVPNLSYVWFEYVHEIIFLCGNCPTIFKISCHIKVGLIFKGSLISQTESVSSVLSLSSLWFWTKCIEILLTWKISKNIFKLKYLTYSICRTFFFYLNIFLLCMRHNKD